MNIIVNAKHMELTDNLREYAEEKMQRFSKYLSNITEAMVTLSVEKYRHKVEVLMKANGSLIQAESITDEMYSAIDEVVEKIERQIKKHKGKLVSKRKGREKTGEALAAEDIVPKIIKSRSFDTKPMSIEEAAMQMAVLNRDFFIFTNASSGQINVLHKRKDGNLGHIEPLK
ncbi:MAG: ribosome-associated translation inhibitor RaiA [Nitrospirae bacterium]|nr:ribosome-associated translation inhibitor RaiA [Nitrospirota bacterium]